MPYTDQQLRKIYDRTDGFCHICHKKLSINNYASPGCRGAWEVEHSRPKSKGGTDHGNNLYAACIKCNRDKSNRTTRTARGWNGKSRAPHSKSQKKKISTRNALLVGAIGGLIGSAGGPGGVILGTAIGTMFGKAITPPKS